RAVHEVGELQRTEMAPAAFRLGEADDDEVARAVGFDLEPLRRPSSMVGASGVLGDDTLEAERVHLREERGAVALDVIEETNRAEFRNGVREDALALDERERSQIESVEGGHVKRI